MVYCCASRAGAEVCCKDFNHVSFCFFFFFFFQIDKEGVISWVLSLQAHPRNEADLDSGVLSYCYQFYVHCQCLKLFMAI